ncbi:hypothetical protein [Halalkalibacter urbisdiaboli]|uniref:hypothetical protein n=1 Tax=Halalkalibacter urbisdiaboli TaxID=1960589 RepID=UPI000B447857|nr:hypothetical protein [Halalkalibacter urbisdiaboli]
MEKRGIFLSVFIIFLFLVGCSSETSEKPPKSICVDEYEERSKRFNQRVLDDMIKTYELNLDGFHEVKIDDITMEDDKKNLAAMSLKHLFVGKSKGDMRLFINDKEDKGYFLYKRNDGNNVLKEISKDPSGTIWVVLLKHEVEGTNIKWGKEFDWSKCKED